MVEAAIQRTEKKIRGYETGHGMTSTHFVQRYENDELPETLEFAEWIGEYRLLSRLREKADAYRGITFIH
jgi:hypothetical protein